MSIVRRKTLRVLGASLAWAVLTGALGTGNAQEPAKDGNVPAVDVTVRNESEMSGQQQIAWVGEQTSAAKGIGRRVQSMLDRARKEKDTLKITCLDDKLTQINVNLRGIEEREAALKVSVQGGDRATANQQFTILKIYFSRIRGLMAEAESCVGDVDVVLGEAETTVTVDDNITLEDPSSSPVEQVGVEQPPHASGYF
jgi:hypothetical protein